MKNNYITGRNPANPFNSVLSTFTVSYRGIDGITLHGVVTQLSQNDYQVFVKEKGVIIQCRRNDFGILTCELGTKRNLPWVDGIKRAVAQIILEQ